jgi:hypothetical protein
MAAEQPAQRQPAAARYAVAPDGCDRVPGAARLVAARGAQHRRERELVDANHSRGQPLGTPSHRGGCAHFQHPPLSASRSNAAVNSGDRSSPAAGRALTTKSMRSRISPRVVRNHSRTARLTRFRTTAFPTLRLTLIPRRRPLAPSATQRIKAVDAARLPHCRTCRYSLGKRIRSARPKRPVARLTATWTASLLRGASGPLSGGA